MRNYNDSENCYNKKAQNNVQNQAQNSYSNRTTDSYSYENRAQNSQNCRDTKEENSMTDSHRDKDTSGKDSEDEWKSASTSRNATKSDQARNAADNCKRQ